MTVFLCDVSGSVYGNPSTTNPSNYLLDDMKDQIDKMGGVMDRVICFDDSTHGVQPIAEFFRKHPHGGCGTNIKVAIAAAMAEAEEEEDIVMMTDGFYHPDDVPDFVQVFLFGR